MKADYELLMCRSRGRRTRRRWKVSGFSIDYYYCHEHVNKHAVLNLVCRFDFYFVGRSSNVVPVASSANYTLSLYPRIHHVVGGLENQRR